MQIHHAVVEYVDGKDRWMRLADAPTSPDAYGGRYAWPLIWDGRELLALASLRI